MAEPLEAPWTDEIVQALNEYQHSGVMHPYTCPDGHELVATGEGWVCEHDSYRQFWAHPFTADQQWVTEMKNWKGLG